MLTKIFPFLGWFRSYNLSLFRADIISGLTVALVLIPQSMAYAQLAGLPVYYGLYASFLPPMFAPLFGSTLQLATGPVAVVSLMTAASLSPLATTGSPGFIAYAIMLAFMVGVFQFLLGVLRLGLVVNFLSHPVVNGFTNAAAIIIASSQFSKLFGVYVDSAEHHYETIYRVVQAALDFTHWPTLFMGVLAFSIMFGLKRISPKIPNVLVAVAVTIVLSWSLDFERNARVDVEQIAVPRAVERMHEFNTTIDAVSALSEERTRLNEALDQAKASGDSLARIDAEHDLEVINARIGRYKEQAHLIRTELRSFFFLRSKEPVNSDYAYYDRENIPSGVEVQEPTLMVPAWRLRVGNTPLALDDLQLMGGGAVVGVVPSGLPTLSMPAFDFRVLGTLIPYAALISLLGFMEAIPIAQAMAPKPGQPLHPNQELIGQGLANILGSVGQSYPVSGSFSRSAVNLQAGAITGLSSVFTSLLVVVVLLFFTPLLYHLPQAVLAAVIMMAVIGLINASGFMHAWKAQWYDGAISVISFVATLAFAPHLDKGIMIGVVLSLLVFLYKSMRPRVASLSLYEDESHKDATAFGLAECQHLTVVRFDGTLFFANASFLEDQITDRLMKMKQLKHIIIESSGINDMDASGEEALSLIVDRVRSAGLDISFSGVKESVMHVMQRTHLYEHIGEDHFYPTLDKAICSIHHTGWHPDGEECPLTNVCQLPTATRG